MNVEESVLDIATRFEAGLEISRNDILLVLQYVRVLIERVHRTEENSQIKDESLQASKQETQRVIAERDALKRSEEVSEEVIRGLRQQLFSERPDLRELQALENELDSLWGVWNDAGRGRYVKLG